MIYRSAQTTGGTNVALFHHAARVAPHDFPEGSTARVYTDESDEDGTHRSFTVFEEIPPAKPSEPKPGHLLHSDVHEEPPPETYLQLDMESIRIHEVSAVAYTTEEYPVFRHRITKGLNQLPL